jgi:hypothetical protein
MDCLFPRLFLRLRRPALLHEAEQVLDGLFIAAIFLDGKLVSPFIELGSHFNGFIGWATQRDQDFGKMRIFHGKAQGWENGGAGTIVVPAPG